MSNAPTASSSAATVTTRRAAQSAKIQTRGMLREQHDKDQQRIQQQGARKPNQALLEAKRRAKQQQQLQQSNSGSSLAKDIYQTAMDAMRLVRGRTGLVYDDRMAEHRCLWDPEFPECPERFTRVLERCAALELTERCERISARPATVAEVLLKHTQQHYDLLAATAGHADEQHLEEFSSRYDAIYVHPTTFELSLLAVGATCELLDAICGGRVQNGMAIIRPPGHHAMKAEFNGYCFFNNVAVAAQRALDRGDARRILIVDWDVHHGQATQRAFYDDPRVLYVSVHRYEHGTFWPNLRESNYDCVGEGAGAGRNINVPLNAIGMQNADYLAVWQQLLMPVAMEFEPDLVIVSAGYDAALGCPEGEMEITPACYAHLLAPLMTLAAGRCAVILEGGYCLQSLAEGASLTLRTLLGDPCPPLADRPTAVSASMRTTILNCIHALRPYWRALQTHRTYGAVEQFTSGSQQPQLHRVEQRYEWTEPPPERFPTRAWYPVQTGDVKAALAERLTQLAERTDLRVAPGGVGYVFDAVMLEHRNLYEDHPERPERLTAIEQRFTEYGLLPGRLQPLAVRAATTDELCTAHSRLHVNRMRRTSGTATATKADEANADTAAAESLRSAADTFNSVYFHPRTFDAASAAAGAVLTATEAVCAGRLRSAICAVRPPGHHAESDEPHGFCIFNSVAVAARVAVRDWRARRVLIVDWDVHHGNGTQHTFECSAEVLYVSVHRYDRGTFFPKRADAGAEWTGEGAGRGFNVNVPWNRKGMGDAEYAQVFQRIIMPIAYEFGPDLVLVSAGFDAAVGDPLGGCRVTPEAFGHFTAWLSALAMGRLVVCLEGGYNVNSVAYAMAMCAKALLGDPLPALQMTSGAGPGRSGLALSAAAESCVETLQEVWAVQEHHWRSLEGWNVWLPEAANGPAGANVLQSVRPFDLEHAFGAIRLEGGADKRPADEKNVLYCVVDEEAGAAGGSISAGDVKTLSSYLEALQNAEMFAVFPLSDCPHLGGLPAEADAAATINTRQPCADCAANGENWLCLHCAHTGCGRFVAGHMAEHNAAQPLHALALSLADLSVWCYACEAYVDNARLYRYKNAAHVDKFGEPMPWSYGDDDDAGERTATITLG